MIPTLYILHRCNPLPNSSSDPHIMPRFQVDKGAIKHILNGSDVMCRGLTSPAAEMDMTVGINQFVAIQAEGKEHALGIGLTTLSAEKM